MKETIYAIRDRKTGERYSCFTQMVNLNYDGRWVLRYNIGIQGYTEWTNVCCEYSNDEFNARYEVLGVERSLM